MPFPRPTLGALIRDGEASFAARLPGADLALRRSNLKVTARVFGGLLHQQYGYLDWQFRQLIPDTAEDEYLDRWARIFNIERKGATLAGGSATFSGTIGTTIPAGTALTRPDRILFQTTADLTLAGATGSVGITAIAGGTDGNLPRGTILALVTAMYGVIGVATIDAGGTTGGTEAELDPALRARVLARIRQPPQGGAAADYVDWALAVPGVTRAWSLPRNRGAGTVDLTFVMDDRDNIIPTPTDVAAVQAVINAKRPVTADSIVFAPTAVSVPISIANLSPDTTAVRAAALAELQALFRRDAAPAATLYRSRIWEAVSIASGEQHHTLVIPAADTPFAAGEMPVLGAVTFL